MTLLDALRHQWRRRIRSPTWGQSLIGGLILVLAAAYFGVLFVGVGWFFPQIVEEVAPQQNPLRLLNEGLHAAKWTAQKTFFHLDKPSRMGLRPTGRSDVARAMW